MKLNFGIVAAFAGLLTAQTSLAAPASDVVAREAEVDGHLYICTDANWGGDCDDYGFTAGACSNFPSQFQDDISSVGPDSGWVCILYIDWDCSTDQGIYTVTAPGYPDLSQDWGNDAFSSFVCDRS